MQRVFLTPLLLGFACALPDLALGQVQGLRQVGAHETRHANATCVRFHPDGELVATTGFDGAVRVWNTSDWSEERELDPPRGQHWSLAFSPDGKYLACGSDFEIRVWSLSKKKEWKHEALKVEGDYGPAAGSVYALRFTPDSKHLAGGLSSIQDESSPAVRFWDTKRWKVLEPEVAGHSADGQPAIVEFLAFSADGKAMASGGYTKAMRVWSAVRSRRAAPWMEAADHEDERRGGQQVAHTMCAAFSPDGDDLVVGSTNGRIVLYGGKSWKERRKLDAHPGSHVTQVLFTRDGKRMISSGIDLRVWDTKSWERLSTCAVDGLDAGGKLMTFDLSPDEGTVVATDTGGKLLVFAVE